MIELRDYQVGDDAGIYALIRSSLAPYGFKPDPERNDASLKDITRFYIRRGGAFRVLVDGGQLIGSCALYRIDDATCEMRKMFLLPEYQGRGLGKRMLLDALSIARRLGYKEVTLETRTVLKKAISLYAKNGFETCRSELGSDTCSLVMSKLL